MYNSFFYKKNLLFTLFVFFISLGAALSCSNRFGVLDEGCAMEKGKGPAAANGQRVYYVGLPLMNNYANEKGEVNPDQGSMRYYPQEDFVHMSLVPFLDDFYSRLKGDFLVRGLEEQKENARKCLAAQGAIKDLTKCKKALLEQRTLLEEMDTVKKLEESLKQNRLQSIKAKGAKEGLDKRRDDLRAYRNTYFKTKGAHGKALAKVITEIAEIDRRLREQEDLRKITAGESAKQLVHPFLLVQDYVARVTNNTDWLDAIHGTNNLGSYSGVVRFPELSTGDQNAMMAYFTEDWLQVRQLDARDATSLFRGLFSSLPLNNSSEPYPFLGSILDLCSVKTGVEAFGSAIHATSAYASGFDVMQKRWEVYKQTDPNDRDARTEALGRAREASRSYKEGLRAALKGAAGIVVDVNFRLVDGRDKKSPKSVGLWGKFIGFTLHGAIFDGEHAYKNRYLQNLHISLIKHSHKFHEKRSLAAWQRERVLLILRDSKDLAEMKIQFQTVEGQYNDDDEDEEGNLGTPRHLLAVIPDTFNGSSRVPEIVNARRP